MQTRLEAKYDSSRTIDGRRILSLAHTAAHLKFVIFETRFLYHAIPFIRKHRPTYLFHGKGYLTIVHLRFT